MDLTVTLRHDAARYAIFKYFWIIALMPKAVQLVLLGLLLCLMVFRTDRKLQPDGFFWMQVFCLGVYALAIVTNTILYQHAMSRVFAAVNTCGITAVAVIFYHFYRRITLDYRRLGKYAVINLLILIGLWLYFRASDKMNLPLLLGRELGEMDWINGLLDIRFIGFLDYANLVVFMIIFFYPFAMIYLQHNRLVTLLLTGALFLVVEDTNSRTGLILMAVLVLAYVILELQKSFFNLYKRRRAQTWIFAILLVLVGIVVCYDMILAIVDKIISLRTGSNNMRLYIYGQSMKKLFAESPVIGVAIKDLLDFGEQQYPLGSHSTYIGMFYKIGLLGGTVYMISIITVAVSILKSKDKDRHLLMLKVCIVACFGLMALEDIDGANWCVCIFYSLLAIVRNPGWNTEDLPEIKTEESKKS